MSVDTELDRIVEAKASMRQSIINKGVDVPEDVMVEELPEYIAQISTGPSIFQPDLSHVQSAEELANLQNIVSAGKASEYLELGQTILVPYDTYTMPFEIVGFEDIEARIDGEDQTRHAINLLTKYTSDFNSPWATNGSIKYLNSNLRVSIINTFQNKLDANFLACLGKTRNGVYNRDGTTTYIHDRLFAPSLTQMGVPVGVQNSDQQGEVEGTVFAIYVGTTSPMRKKQSINSANTILNYWTRSLRYYEPNSFSRISDTGAPNYSRFDTQYPFAVACNFIGGDN